MPPIEQLEEDGTADKANLVSSPLTAESHATTGRNLYDGVKGVFPEATDEEVHSLLWCCTPFPCTNYEGTIEALQHMRVKASSPEHAIWLAHAEMDLIWEETRPEREALEASA